MSTGTSTTPTILPSSLTATGVNNHPIPKKIVRNLSLKRMKNLSNPSNEVKIKLERILGLTVGNNNGLTCDPESETIAYPSGCVVVLLNVRTNKQSHIVNSCKKTITSLSFSADGKYLLTGECGHQPSLRVWDTKTLTQLGEFGGHKYGITCVALSPNAKYAVSVGSQHDMIVNVWDWKNNVKVASNKVSAKVKAISFAVDGSYFVTVGNRHVKFWYLDYSRPRTAVEAVPLMGRSAILGDQRNNNFCDVGCGRGVMAESTFAITESGLLCEFNSRRLLDKWVELRTTSANSLSVGDQLICIGCADGIVRVFSPSTLHFLCTLPRPHVLGVDLAKGLSKTEAVTVNGNSTNTSKYASVVAVTLDENAKRVSCVYSDHSMYIWDVRDTKKVGKLHSYLYHSACIWGIEVVKKKIGSNKSFLPPGSFITCSSDDTIRIWNLDWSLSLDNYVYKRNIFSRDLLKILYIDPELKFICDPDLRSYAKGSNEKLTDNSTYDGKNGVRCLKLSPDGQHLASGDRSGNIRIFDFESEVDECKIEAHDSEVLCLEYSESEFELGPYFLGSASRDRLIHIFDVNRRYSFVQTLDDHNSAITSIKFVPDPEGKHLQLISCGADKSIIFRKMKLDPIDQFTRENNVVGKTTLYDMELDETKTHVITACQDRQIRVHSVDGGRLVNNFKGCPSDDGTLIKVTFDPSGRFIATSSTDKTLSIVDYTTREVIATASGHSELITGLKFSPNGRNLISVSGDGCIFVWKLHSDIANNISEKLGLPPVPPEKPSFLALDKVVTPESTLEEEESPLSTKVTSSSGNLNSLPSWAKKQIGEESSIDSPTRMKSPSTNSPNVWTKRVEKAGGIVVKSYLSSDGVISYPLPPSKINGSNGISEDSPSNETMELSSPIENTASSPFGTSTITVDNGHIYYANPRLMPSMSVPNFNDLESDEEADNGVKGNIQTLSPNETKKNPLYLSTENLDKIDQRRKFLEKNVENLDRVDTYDKSHSRSSLSAMYNMSHPTSALNMSEEGGADVTELSSGRNELTAARRLVPSSSQVSRSGFKDRYLNSSRSVVNLANWSSSSRRVVHTVTDPPVKRSTSFSDLTIQPRRILDGSNMKNGSVWGQGTKPSEFSGRAKVKQVKCQGPWGTPSPLTPGARSLRRSGRMSAPLQPLHRVNGDRYSSDDSSSDEESSSSFASKNLRPGTPPKPSILRQIRRSSTSQVIQSTFPKPTEPRNVGTKSRKLWGNFELRSSKSEYNLSCVGRESSLNSRSGSKSNLLDGSIWGTVGSQFNLSSTNPTTVELDRDICEKAVRELAFVSAYIRKLHRRAATSGNIALTNLLQEGVSKCYFNLSSVSPTPDTATLARRKFPVPDTDSTNSLPPETMSQAMNLLQQYSDRLLNLVEEKITRKD